MKLGLRIRKAVATWVAKALTLSGVDSNRGWLTLWNSDTHTGSWQQDVRASNDDILRFSPAYAAVTLIASDVAKVCLQLMERKNRVWVETESPSYSPVLYTPNHFQSRQQFIENWMLSKLLHGNAYILKQRNNRGAENAGNVKAMYVLDPIRVTPLVAVETGAVFYNVMRDDLSRLPADLTIPASEIIHDRMECLFHPLVGISPLYAAALPSSQGTRIQQNSETFFKNMSRPGGMLTAPGEITDETAKRLKSEFEKNFSGDKIGRLFVGGDGLEYKPMAVDAERAQLVEQLEMSAQQVSTAFHIPAYMLGIGEMPNYNSIAAMTQEYYQRALQKHFNAIEDLLDIGLSLDRTKYRTQFDLEELMRMDAAARFEAKGKAVKDGWMKPNEARESEDLPPVTGGDDVYLQQQNYSLSALAKRDAKEDPFAKEAPSAPAPQPTANDEEAAEAATDKALFLLNTKSPEALCST